MAREGKKKKTTQAKVPPEPCPAPIPRGNPLTICVVLAVLTLVLYGRVGGFEFINFDDGDYVVESAYVKNGLTWEGVKWAFTGTQVANWHPVTTLSLLVNSQLFGLGAGSFHLFNLLFHVANSVLVFLVLKKITGATWRSAVVAALFAWHPLHVESVAWVSERKDVLSGFFGLLTLWAYARYVARPTAGRYALTLVFFALGLMSKPMLVTLPFVLLLLDFWPLRRLKPPLGEAADGRSLGELAWEKAPFFALCILASVVTFLVQQKTGAVATTEFYAVSERFINALVSYSRYVEKTFWPANLAVFYPYPRTWPAWRVGGAIGLLAVISAGVLMARRRRPYLAMGWCWFLGMLVPVIGLVQVGSQSLADRYTYLPLLGIFVMLAWGGTALAEASKAWRALIPVLTAAALAGCFVLSWRQIGFWQDSVTLFQHAITVTKRNEFAHLILGQAQEGRGNLAEAVAQYQEAIRIQPKSVDVHFHLGAALAKQGKAEEAMRQFQEVLRLKPSHFEARYNLAGIYFQAGRLGDAEAQFGEAERLKPDSADGQCNLALTLLAQDKLEPAAEHFAKALKVDPGHSHARVNFGYTLSRLGRTGEAVNQYRETLVRAPDFTMALYRLSWLLATDVDAKFRNGAEAVRLAEQAVRLAGGSDPIILDALAAAYAEAGRFAEAIRAEQAAIQNLAGKGQPQIVNEMNQRLALYQNNTPYHAPAR